MMHSSQLKWMLVFLLILTAIPASRSIGGLNDEPFFIRSSKPEFCHIGCTAITAMCYQAMYYYLGTSISASTAIIVFCNSGGDWCKNGCGHFAVRDAENVPDPVGAIAGLVSEPAAGATATLLNPMATPAQKLQALLGLKPGGGAGTPAAAAAAAAHDAAAAFPPISMQQKLQAFFQTLGLPGVNIEPGSSLGVIASLLDPGRLQAALDVATNNANAKLLASGLPEMPLQTLLPLFRRDVGGEEGGEGRNTLDEASESVAQIAGGLTKLLGLGTGTLSNVFHDLTVTLVGNTTTFSSNSNGQSGNSAVPVAPASEVPTTTAEAREAPSEETPSTDPKFRQSIHNLLGNPRPPIMPYTM